VDGMRKVMRPRKMVEEAMMSVVVENAASMVAMFFW
jgi:hypothetical protein